MKIIHAPEPLIRERLNQKTIFLAGSIEMGKAEDWQSKAIESLKNDDITVFNPRRKDWDSTWEQKIENPKFNEQVNWELNAMEMADIIYMYFAPDTKSPISLLELGLFARSGKLLVCCKNGFWRKGNVDIVCKRYGITQVQDGAIFTTANTPHGETVE